MKTKSTSPRQIAIIAIIFAITGIWCIVSAIIGLTRESKDLNEAFGNVISERERYEGKVELASPCILEMKHTVNLIPAGKEYFYAVFSEDESNAVIVRAGKKWGENFNSDTFQSCYDMVIDGTVKRLSYKAKAEIDTIATEFAEYDINLTRTYYIDLLAKRFYIIRIIVGAGTLLLAGLLIFALTAKYQNSIANGTKSSLCQKIVLIAILPTCLLALYILIMK